MDLVGKKIGLWESLDQVFTFDEAKDAFDHMIAKRHAGKITTKVCRVGTNAGVSQCSSQRRAFRGEQSRGAYLDDDFASLDQYGLRLSIESQLRRQSPNTQTSRRQRRHFWPSPR